jgi:hypothetical protein
MEFKTSPSSPGQENPRCTHGTRHLNSQASTLIIHLLEKLCSPVVKGQQAARGMGMGRLRTFFHLRNTPGAAKGHYASSIFLQ